MNLKKKSSNLDTGYKISKFEFIKAWLFAKKRNKRMVFGGEEALKITPDSIINMALTIEEHARKTPDKAAILYEDVKYTHKEYNEWCNRYANYFRNKVGLKKGDVAIVYMLNRPEIMFAIYGLAKIGVISSLINTKQRKNPLKHSIKLAPGKVFIIGEELIEPFMEVKEELDLDENQEKHIYIVPDTGKNTIPDGFKNLNEELKDEDNTNPPTSTEILAKDPYAYIFTSGTTGLPKAAIITHGHTVGSSIYWGDSVVGMEPDDIVYICLPLFHSNAINVGYAAAVRYGSTIAIGRRFSASRFWDDVIKYKATCFNYIGEICRYLYNQPPKPTDRKHRVKKIVGNGLRNDMWIDFKKRFGIKQIFEFYGATERFCPNFANRFNLNCTVGMTTAPYVLTKYDIYKDEPVKDENGKFLKVEMGEPGLLLGQVDPATFYMYTNKDADEKKIFRDVFEKGDMYMNTGDMLREVIEIRGWKQTQFADRLGDTFRWKGENVSTEEVEAVINLFAPVEMSCVYGVLIPKTEGRAGMASICLKNKNIDSFDFNEFLNTMKKFLAEYAIPKFIRFKEKFPMTSTMKIQKGGFKKEGYDLNLVKEPMYVLLPKSNEYIPLSQEIYEGIIQGNYSF
jgi:acyl-CoA synthetase (AMP-forming)/AMP-acid ligase II